MIIIAGVLHVDPQERSAYLEATFEVAGLAPAFPGCADFVQAADPRRRPTLQDFVRRGALTADVGFTGLPERHPE